jgi:hypothetical protein
MALATHWPPGRNWINALGEYTGSLSPGEEYKGQQRQLDIGFYGIGCPHPGVECLVAQIFKLLVHYDCQSGLGIQLQVSMKLFLTELGILAQPLQESYERYVNWITSTWIKSVWEKVMMFSITVEIAPLPVCPPREGDKWFMQAAMDAGVTNTDELRILNRFCCHQQVVYVSDVLDAGGKCLNRRYLGHRKHTEICSTLIFPQEKPPNKHLKLWRQVLYAIAPRGRLQDQIGRFTTKGCKIWEWRYDEASNKVYHLKGIVMDVYGPSLVRNYANRPNCWTRLRIDIPLNECGEICSMKDEALVVKSIILHSPRPPTQATPLTFWEVIRGWGNTWMWDNLAITGNLDWIAASIADNSCVPVTDGLYMKDLYPYLNSAAFVLECSKSRGRLMGSFVENTPNAGSYRGELLGLMAIHLIL